MQFNVVYGFRCFFSVAFDNLLQNNGPEKKSTATKIDNQDSSSDSD